MTHLMSPQNRRYGPIFVIFGHKKTEFTITDAMATARNVHLGKYAILILLRSVLPLKIELHVGICRIRGQCWRTDPDFDAADFRANEKNHLEFGSGLFFCLRFRCSRFRHKSTFFIWTASQMQATSSSQPQKKRLLLHPLCRMSATVHANIYANAK